MGSIRPLSEAVHSTVRSGIIVYDLTRVVEELVLNSLDAGATKVYVAVGVGICSVKVVDNGSGVDRDGLVLLGERYATSRHDYLAGLGTNGSFGFRGEALCSIADVSLIEIMTKAQRMPHGYQKVMKGRKCLYLGIDDDRRDVGTTVVVRDLFYNQPVRRKQMQSSPKKVLHSVKKCILRIALVHSRVSFRLADLESEDELLRTGSSPSPLPLLSGSFGIEASSSLHELKACEGELKLWGYISGPFGISSPKDFQYIYVNSRFVCKGPMHKLLNQLSAGYWNDRKFEMEPEHDKRIRSQICATFILNLSCPRYLYDLTFEPSKNSVEFRDWGSILTFCQNAVACIWRESISGDFLINSEKRKKRCRTQKWMASLQDPSSEHQNLTEDCTNLPAWRVCLPSCQKSSRDVSELEKRQTEALANHDTSVQSCYSPFRCGQTANKKSRPSFTWSSHNFPAAEDTFGGKGYTSVLNNQMNLSLGSKWHGESFERDDKVSRMYTGCALLADYYGYCDNADTTEDFENLSELSCSAVGSLPQSDPSFSNKVGFEFKQQTFGEKNDWDQTFEDTLSTQDEVKPVWSISRCSNIFDLRAYSNFPSLDSKSTLASGDCSDEEEYLPPDSVKHINTLSSDRHLSTPESDRTPLESSPLFGNKLTDIDSFISNHVQGSHSAYDEDYRYLVHEEDHKYTVNMGVHNWIKETSSVSGHVDFSFDKFSVAVSDDNRKSGVYNYKDPVFPNYAEVSGGNIDRWHLNCCNKISHPEFSDSLYFSSVSAQSGRNRRGADKHRNETAPPCKRMAGRSLSAPPCYRQRKKYATLSNALEMANNKTNFLTINGNLLVPGAVVNSSYSRTTCTAQKQKHKLLWIPGYSTLNHQQQLVNQCDTSGTPNFVDLKFSVDRSGMKKSESFEFENRQLQIQGQSINSFKLEPVQDFISMEIEDVSESGQKWHDCFQGTGCGVKSHNIEDQNTVLDISSGILHLSGDSLVPSTIDKNSLEDARVLQQVGKKFIPIIARRTLAIIDQHAADERIRLEELRQKVLSGEIKEITHLESEQELALPEIGYQLLHNYGEQIRNWGWICHTNGQGSRSFTKNLNVLHRQPNVARLIAVPCILGVNLTDVDLLEFLQQLADTDGSSTIPPSVYRVLNNKACRGAIMFGDTLLPSECSLIVEELKQTSLCLQCAHGRPTTVPLVNLEALHKQINKLGLCSSGRDEIWHGLRRHEISLERAAYRLNSAID